MALRNILHDGDPTLAKKSRTVESFDDRLHELLDDMHVTMYHANGVGLAAPQIGVLRRVVLALDYGDFDGEMAEEITYELINPEIIYQSGENRGQEGCLSVPGLVGFVTRPDHVKVKAQDRYGKWFELDAHGLLARILCHEIDHLDGLLYKRLCDRLYDRDNAPEEE